MINLAVQAGSGSNQREGSGARAAGSIQGAYESRAHLDILPFTLISHQDGSLDGHGTNGWHDC